VLDAQQNLWILCSGQWNSTYTALVKKGKLVRYNTFTNTIDKEIEMPYNTSQPNSLKINGAGNTLFFNYDGYVYKLPTSATQLNTPIIKGYFQSLGVDPKTDIIYLGDAKDYASNGVAKRYDMMGTLLDSFAVGIVPTEFVFYNK
jgi:hypothetical protein